MSDDDDRLRVTEPGARPDDAKDAVALGLLSHVAERVSTVEWSPGSVEMAGKLAVCAQGRSRTTASVARAPSPRLVGVPPGWMLR